jgi:hypothetical protein
MVSNQTLTRCEVTTFFSLEVRDQKLKLAMIREVFDLDTCFALTQRALPETKEQPVLLKFRLLCTISQWLSASFNSS